MGSKIDSFAYKRSEQYILACGNREIENLKKIYENPFNKKRATLRKKWHRFFNIKSTIFNVTMRKKLPKFF